MTPGAGKPVRLSGVLLRAATVGAGLLAGAAATTAAVRDGVGASFSHKDWALQCDNTRTCRAVGYQAETGESAPVSMLLTRKAGAHAPVEVELQAYTDNISPEVFRLKVGKLGLSYRNADNPSIPASQVPSLLQELLRAEEATVTAGKEKWVLSLAGVAAVLLKMDEVQGRIGTPGALVRKGTKPESSVLPPVSAPVLKAVKPVPTRKSDTALVKPLLAALGADALEGQCTGGTPEASVMKVHRLTDSKLLLEVPCGMGAYNFSSLLFMVNDRPPYQPKAIEDVDGEFDPDAGTVRSSMKGRGIGDCWWVREWRFDGKDFVLSDERGDAMCRGFPGGAWSLPVYVTQ